MNEAQMGHSLRALPRVKASPAFTSEVLREVRRAEARRPAPFAWRLAAAFAMVFCLVAVVQFAVMQQARRRHIEELRVEQQRIEAALEAVKKSAVDAEPVFVFENDDGTRVIVDFDSAVQPASYRTFD